MRSPSSLTHLFALPHADHGRSANPSYSVEWLSAARKDARVLSRPHLERVRSIVLSLLFEPRPHNAAAKHGPLRGLLGIALGRLRILYRVDDHKRRVEIARVGDRKEVYRFR